MKKLICLLSLFITVSFLSSCSDDDESIHVGYSGEDLTKDFSITRDKETKEAYLNIKAVGAWKLYAGSSVDNIDLSNPIKEGNTSGTVTLDVSTATRSYFMIETSKGTTILADRHLPMTEGYNFRDLGGYKTQGGKFVKWGVLFRADELAKLTDADLKYLASIPLTTVVDFRSDSEIEKAPDVLPSSVKNTHQFKIEQQDPLKIGNPREMTKEDFQKFAKDITIDLVVNEEAIAELKNFFKVLQADNSTPLLYHCTAGKDRTGVSSALILYALGVDKETIYADYLLSNDYVMDKYAGYISKLPVLKYAFELQREYLEEAFDSIEENHGSVDKFLTDVLAVDINKMRNKYLY